MIVLTKAGVCYPVCEIVLIGRSSLCGGSGFPLLQSEWYHCLTPYNRKYNVLSASLNKTFPSFLPSFHLCDMLKHSSTTMTKLFNTGTTFALKLIFLHMLPVCCTHPLLLVVTRAIYLKACGILLTYLCYSANL